VRRRCDAWERLKRLVHYRLVIPLKRSRHPPEYTARGVAIGLFWAFTPLVGIQMPIIFAFWIATRSTRNLNFNLIAALAWTWVTNIFTVWPVYYTFYVTGRIMLGQWDLDLGYDRVVESLKAAFMTHDGYFESIAASISAIAKDQGLPLVLGSIPYAVGTAWAGYAWSRAFLDRWRLRRETLRAMARTKRRNRR